MCDYVERIVYLGDEPSDVFLCSDINPERHDHITAEDGLTYCVEHGYDMTNSYATYEQYLVETYCQGCADEEYKYGP